MDHGSLDHMLTVVHKMYHGFYLTTINAFTVDSYVPFTHLWRGSGKPGGQHDGIKAAFTCCKISPLQTRDLITVASPINYPGELFKSQLALL